MLDSMQLGHTQRTMYNQAAEQYATQMGDQAYEYLEQRGISKEVATRFAFGFVADPLKGAGHDNMRNRLCIPYLTVSGVVGLKFRAISADDGIKYLIPPGQHPRLYNTNAFHQPSNHIAIVEGELDAVIMDALVGVPAIGVPGASMWFEHHPRCFADYERILIVCDNDTKKDKNSGQELAKKVQSTLKRAINVVPPNSFDINEWYLADGAEKIRTRLGLDLQTTKPV